LVIDCLASQLTVELFDEKAGAVALARVDDKRIVIAKPATYVNTSGPVIKGLLDHFRVVPANLIVVHDDLDLDFAKVRVKQGGGSGGHRGLNSISAALGVKDFARIRIGIGRPPGRMDPSDFVLSPFSPKERPEIEVALAEGADAAIAVVRDGVNAAMNRYNKERKS
jgi:PTH1 family peptidyl-tRNA hydrolase